MTQDEFKVRVEHAAKLIGATDLEVLDGEVTGARVTYRGEKYELSFKGPESLMAATYRAYVIASVVDLPRQHGGA